jgi:hypothetical protein
MVTVALENIDELSVLNFVTKSDSTQYLKLKCSKGVGCRMIMDVVLDLENVVKNPYGQSVKLTVMDANKYVEGFEKLMESIKEHYEVEECKFPFGEDGSLWMRVKPDFILPEDVEKGSILKSDVEFGGFVNGDQVGIYCSLKALSLPKVKLLKKKSIKKE